MWVFRAFFKTVSEHRLSSHAALSPDTKHIALANLGDGVDVYPLGQSHPNVRLKNRPLTEDGNVPVQVSWLLDSAAVVSGSSDGSVHVWTTQSGELLQVLEHKGM